MTHSATKYLGGHSDLTAGAVAGSKDFIDRVRQVSVMTGTTLDPAAAYLLSRGMKTLAVSVKRGCENALLLAQALRLIRRWPAFTIPDSKTIRTTRWRNDRCRLLVELLLLILRAVKRKSKSCSTPCGWCAPRLLWAASRPWRAIRSIRRTRDFRLSN